jgi:hypothetical protein
MKPMLEHLVCFGVPLSEKKVLEVAPVGSVRKK